MPTFSEVKLFQVKPDKIDEFELLITKIACQQKEQEGCINIKYLKRFYTLQGQDLPPRELLKVVKCIKYYSYWEFDNKENYGKANDWLFEQFAKDIMKCLIMPFDINCGENII